MQTDLLTALSLSEFHDVVAASMWTRKDIREFKESINRESKESIIKVGHGETVTVCLYENKIVILSNIREKLI